MKKLLYGVAAVPFLTSIALAGQPVQLTDGQMDKVTAGWSIHEIDTTNNSWTEIAVYGPRALTPACGSCYLDLNISNEILIRSIMSPSANPPPTLTTP